MSTTRTRIACQCSEHNGAAVLIRTPIEPLTDTEKIHHLVRIAHHLLWSKAASTIEHGPWKV